MHEPAFILETTRGRVDSTVARWYGIRPRFWPCDHAGTCVYAGRPGARRPNQRVAVERNRSVRKGILRSSPHALGESAARPERALCHTFEFVHARYAKRDVLWRSSAADRQDRGRGASYQECLLDCVTDVFLTWRVGPWLMIDIHEETRGVVY